MTGYNPCHPREITFRDRFVALPKGYYPSLGDRSTAMGKDNKFCSRNATATSPLCYHMLVQCLHSTKECNGQTADPVARVRSTDQRDFREELATAATGKSRIRTHAYQQFSPSTGNGIKTKQAIEIVYRMDK